jgi:solute carrier family 50 protein (sugar transporter)
MVSVESAVSLAASMVCIAMFVSPAQAALAFKKAGSVGALRINFYTMQLVNCCFWSFYGILLPSTALIFSNLSGLLIAVFCMVLFLSVAKKEEESGKKLLGGMSTHDSIKLVVIALIVTVATLATACIANVSGYHSGALLFMGFAGSAASCVMLASPLQQVKAIVATRNADVLNPSTVVLSVINCFLWTTYGILIGVPFVYVPNAVGQCITLGQLYLLLRYGRSTLPCLRFLHYSRQSAAKSSSDDVSTANISRHDSAHDMTKMVDAAPELPPAVVVTVREASPKLPPSGSFGSSSVPPPSPKLPPGGSISAVSSPKLPLTAAPGFSPKLPVGDASVGNASFSRMTKISA